MNQSWYNTQSWYAPLVSDEQGTELPLERIEELPEAAERKRRKKRSGGLTPGRIAGLAMILIAVIVGSSLAFRQIDDDGAIPAAPFSDPSR